MNMETSQLMAAARHFTLQLSSTRRGARLARLLAVEQLCSWDLGAVAEPVAQIVAELANNAVTHGHVSGRDFRLRVIVTGAAVRIEVTDTQGDHMPLVEDPEEAGETGRGMLIVEALALRWGAERGPAPQKTVWAELALPEADPVRAAGVRAALSRGAGAGVAAPRGAASRCGAT
ncbi:ATP-binding protein [Streptomyces termitum]|uniref:ATP-binding protein n=1 Tax=Streptomyces termitum TaxID=67368 RepID=UPI00379DA005